MSFVSQVGTLVAAFVLLGALVAQGCSASNRVLDMATTPGIDHTVRAGSAAGDAENTVFLKEHVVVTSHLILSGTILAALGCILVILSTSQIHLLTQNKLWPLFLVPGTLVVVAGVVLSISAIPSNDRRLSIDVLHVVDTIMAKYPRDRETPATEPPASKATQE